MSAYAQSSWQIFIPTTQVWPKDYENFRTIMADKWSQMALSLNRKEIGLYPLYPIVTGKTYQNGTALQETDFSYRVLLYGGALPNAGVLTIPHGIPVTTQTRTTKLDGTASTPGTPITMGTITPVTGAAYIPIPFINTTTPGDSVQLTMDETNVYITTTTANYVGYTYSEIVVEWLELSS